MKGMQMIFVILAGVLLQVLILQESHVNNSITDNIASSYIAERALAIGDVMMNRITSKNLAFDEYLLSNPISPKDSSKLTNLSAPLKIESGEVLTNSNTFDDIDDFNGFDTLILLQPKSKHGIRVKCAVQYFDPASGPVASRRWHKIVTLSINDSIIGSKKHFLVNPDSSKLVFTKSSISSFYNITN